MGVGGPAVTPRPYRLLLERVLVRVDAETAHRASFAALRAVARVPGAAAAGVRLLGPRDAALRVRALGLDLPGPVGLAAGFDKDARGVDGLAALGFGFVEVGTVTAVAQPGNPRPRLFRLLADRAVVNRMGFNNAGAAAAAARLARRGSRRGGPRVVVGVNIGRTKAVADSGAVADYVASTRAVAGVADYLVVNVSSPNTPGLRDLQSVEALRPLLVAVREAAAAAGRQVPLLVKIAPDLADADVLAVADLAVELGLDGVVATNTTVSRERLLTPAADVAALGAGGLSGPVLRERSLEVLRMLRARLGPGPVLVSVGGVATADDVWDRVRAGATLVQLYTALVYEGPLLPRRLHEGLAARLHAAGFARLQDAVGSEAVAP